MIPGYACIFIPIFILIVCISTICIFASCKSRGTKNTTATPVSNPSGTNSNHMSSTEQQQSRSRSAIFIVPTTSQVMEMFMNQASVTAATSARDSSSNQRFVPPPSYGVVVDVPPTYEQAVKHMERDVV